jgi:opacity protein-like surface antigen
MRNMTFAVAAMLAVAIASAAFSPALAQQVNLAVPNNTPLTFGMDADETSRALGTSLNYVRGRPGDELYLALPNVKGAALSSRSDGLYLQFRKGRLAGWKGDWGTVRP